MVATTIKGQERDEISQYEDLRSVGSSEAAWHLMAFPIAKRFPPVQTLRVHTEDQQQVVFDEGTEEEALERQRERESSQPSSNTMPTHTGKRNQICPPTLTCDA